MAQEGKVGELLVHLVYHQIRYGAFIFGVNTLFSPPIRDEFGRREVLEEVESVHDSDQGVELDDFLETAQICSVYYKSVPIQHRPDDQRGLSAAPELNGDIHLLQDPLVVLLSLHRAIVGSIYHGLGELLGERLGHLHRLADARALDQDVLAFAGAREPRKLLEQIAPERVADAPVLHLDQAFLRLRDDVAFDQGGVDVERGHVVDDHGDAQ